MFEHVCNPGIVYPALVSLNEVPFELLSCHQTYKLGLGNKYLNGNIAEGNIVITAAAKCR